MIENSDIVEVSLALVGSPQLNVRTVFQGGLRLISQIWPEYCDALCVLLRNKATKEPKQYMFL